MGFALFARQGFEATTVDECIAAAAGIARRTFFAYFASKNDLVRGDFAAHLDGFRAALAAADTAQPMADALREAIIAFNRYDADVPWHRQRMRLILRVPALQADSAVRYAAWREIIVEFAAERSGLPATALGPRLAGHVALAAAVSAYESWLDDDAADLPALLDEALRRVAAGLDVTPGAGSPRPVPR